MTTTTSTPLTTQQTTALATLARGGFATTSHGGLKTGVNTTVLHSLRQLGLIACSNVFLRGVVSRDFTVTAAGGAALAADEPARVTVAPAAADEPTQEIFVAIGPNVWGKGFTQAQALDAAISGNRAARQHHVIFACTDPWAYIDGMGSLVRAIDSTYREVARREPKRGKGVR